ncbi:MAG: Hsp70 suppressor, GTPase facilitates ribosomal subunit dissociation, partial [Phylliscum demangeonii]
DDKGSSNYLQRCTAAVHGVRNLTDSALEQLRLCTALVRQALSPALGGIATREIKDSLWHYYYDVDKTVTWLRNQHTKETNAKPTKKTPNGSEVPLMERSAAEFNGVLANAKAQSSEKGLPQLVPGIQALGVGEGSKIKSKNLNVVAEFAKQNEKPAASFVVIGHVDHGKSTLLGRLLLDLKVVDSRTVEKYRKEAEKIGKSSFALAWVMDQASEERSRGVTMDIATNHFETEKTMFTILDAPGHRDFIPSMIAGASQADFTVLVIDASPNAFESGLKGQTREHALLVRSMGVQRIIVAVNKMDMVNWAYERYEEIQQQTMAFLAAAGFQSKNVSFVPCSGLHGENIARSATDSRASWYQGPCLVEILDQSIPAVRALDKPLRMSIMDVFRGDVVNPVSVSGRIEAGNVQIGDSVLIMPSGEKAKIKGIEVDNKANGWAVAGQNATLHLADIDPVHLQAGDVVCSPEFPIANTDAVVAKVLVFEHLIPMSVDVHRGRLHVSGRISQLVAILDKTNGDVVKKKPKIVKPGTVARIKVALDRMAPLEAPTRIVLRANGETVAAGLVE